MAAEGDRARGARTRRERIGYAFDPVPRALRQDQRVAVQAYWVWSALHEFSGYSNALQASWGEISSAVGRDPQWVAKWTKTLHANGWATITALPGGMNMIVLHTSTDAHLGYRALVPADMLYGTPADTPAPRTPAPAPVVPAQAPPPLSETTGGPIETDRGPDQARGGCSIPRARTRTHEERAHEKSLASAGASACEAVTESEAPAVAVARGMKPVPAAPKTRPTRPPLPARPQADTRLRALHAELTRRGLGVRWGGLDDAETRLIIELVRELGVERLGVVAQATTRAAVSDGKAPAHHVRAYLGTWAQCAPVWESPAPPPTRIPGAAPWDTTADARCPGHPDTALPCGLCAAEAAASRTLLQPEDTTEGARFRQALAARRAAREDNP